MTKIRHGVLLYEGCRFMRQRLALSVLSGKPVEITDIRSLGDEPGLQDFEVNLIRLLDKLTNGTLIEINETGTALFFQPGLLHGGSVEHECSVQRSIGYYLEVLLMLGLFCKEPLSVRLRGVTSNGVDPSVDHVKSAMIPVLKKFILEDEDLKLEIITRGMEPQGGGEVLFKCPIRKSLRPINLLSSGKVKRVRGIAYALRVSPAIANRMVETAKGVLLNFIPDIYISTFHGKGKQSGNSSGFGIHLYAETTTGFVYASEQVSDIGTHSVPEDVGTAASQRLLQEIFSGGCADSAAQSLAILCMALGQKDVSKLVTGPLTPYSVSFLQHLREFFGVTFKLESYSPDSTESDVVLGDDKVLLTCVGIGYTNVSKRTL